nr:MAG TPA: UBA-like domain protein [Microviridae sp.]
MNLKEAFKIRKKDTESNEVIITIGNHLATEQVFKSEEDAQKVIDATDWNLVAALIYACKEAEQWEEEHKNKQQKKEE